MNTQSGTAIVTAERLIKALIFHLEKRLDNVIVFGAPGIGKTEIVKQVAGLLGHDLLIMHPQISDPTDFKGMPAIIPGDGDKEKLAVFLPFAELKAMVDATEDMIVFLDDFGQAPRMVQAAIQQLILERRVDGHKISEKVRFVLCANRAEDKAGVDQGFLTTIKGRATLYTLEPSEDDWCKWAIESDYPAECTAFIRFMGLEGLWARANPEFKPSYGTDNERTPRTVTKCFDQYRDGIPAGLEMPMYQGNTDAGWATSWVAFSRTFHSLPNIDMLYANPNSFEPPTMENSDVLFAITAAIAARAKTSNAAKFFKLIKKLPSDFATFAVKDAWSRNPKIANTNGFTGWIIDNPGVIGD